MLRQIYAAYDDDGVYVYQAYKPEIAQAALRNGTFAEGFSFERMTWIKPSFGWMLYRSGYATKANQEAVLRIKLMHSGWLAILNQAVESVYSPEHFPSETAWKQALSLSEVRFQWDPERHVNGQVLDRRAIQVGMRGRTVHHYVEEWILQLEDVTTLAHAVHEAVLQKQTMPHLPEERVYPVDERLQARLGISDSMKL